MLFAVGLARLSMGLLEFSFCVPGGDIGQKVGGGLFGCVSVSLFDDIAAAVHTSNGP